MKLESGTDKIKAAGLIITLGIVYGDLGTSPLYTMQAIMQATDKPDKIFILGALSCVFWTIMLEATIKYVIITLRASNKGEGGIFSLFAMVKGKVKWAALVAIIGACALMADGVITPAITVTSAMEGLLLFSQDIPVVGLVIIILTLIFVIQSFGTKKIGKLFGPVMFCWFLMLFLLGLFPLLRHPDVIKAINPYYAIHAIIHNKEILKLLGAVFLCTTGAEALYSDLGHVGLKNIRITWLFVSLSLLVNYFGQGAWIIHESDKITASVNPYFAIMPHWFKIFGVIISTLAAIIASQALITGTFTIISEAISLNFFPKVRISYPTNLKRQMYVPQANWLLYVCCLFVVIYFQNSTAMESAYGLAISFAMICTSILLVMYLYKRVSIWLIIAYVIVYSFVEIGFLAANITKFFTGGWVTVLLGGFYISIMYTWSKTSVVASIFIRNRDLRSFIPVLAKMKSGTAVPKYATNLIYLTETPEPTEIETSILYSILRIPKRADTYWFINIITDNEPYTLGYHIFEIEPGMIYKINMRIGFKEKMKVTLYFHQILQDLVSENKFSLLSNYPSLHDNNILTDFKFIVIDNIQNKDYEFSFKQQIAMNYYFFLKRILVNEISYWGLDQTISYLEKIPLLSATNITVDSMSEEKGTDSGTVLQRNMSDINRISPE